MSTVLFAILLPPVVPFATGHIWLFLATCCLMATGIGWPIASLIAVILIITEGDKEISSWGHVEDAQVRCREPRDEDSRVRELALCWCLGGRAGPGSDRVGLERTEQWAAALRSRPDLWYHCGWCRGRAFPYQRIGGPRPGRRAAETLYLRERVLTERA